MTNRNRRRGWLAAVGCALLLALSGPATAAEPTPALPAGAARTAADLASYGTLAAGLTLETWDAWHCADKAACLYHEGMRLAVTGLVVQALKMAVHRARPCAPACGIDSPFSSFPSGHAAFAGQTVTGGRKGLKAGLAAATSGLRVLADKHHGSDAAAGFGIGWGTTLFW